MLFYSRVLQHSSYNCIYGGYLRFSPTHGVASVGLHSCIMFTSDLTFLACSAENTNKPSPADRVTSLSLSLLIPQQATGAADERGNV